MDVNITVRTIRKKIGQRIDLRYFDLDKQKLYVIAYCTMTHPLQNDSLIRAFSRFPSQKTNNDV